MPEHRPDITDATQRDSGSASSPPGGAATILVIEDNPITLKMMRVALQSSGYKVLCAENGREALELVARQPDLVLTDIFLPDIRGTELMPMLRRVSGNENLPILAVTGFLSSTEVAQTAGAGFNDVLIKPVEISHLLAAIKLHLPSATPVPARAPLVMLVDDDPLQLKHMRLLLGQAGYKVETAADGAALLERVRQQRPDVVVSDVLMPGLDGFDICFAIRSDPQLRNLPVVLTTANCIAEADQQLAESVGASAYVTRLSDPGELAAVVREAIRRPPATLASNVEALLPAQRWARTVRQLERQLALQQRTQRQCAIQAALMEQVGMISEAMSASRRLDEGFDNLLAHFLDEAGISRGLLYLSEPSPGGQGAALPGDRAVRLHGSGGLRLKAQLGCGGMLPAAQALFGAGALFGGVTDSGVPMVIRAADGNPDAAGMLAAAQATGALLLPLRRHGDHSGLLVMLSSGRELAGQDWLAFGRTLAGHFGQMLSLIGAYEQLQESEYRFRQMANNIRDVFFLSDVASKRILYVSPAYEDIWGRSCDSLYADPESWTEAIHPDDRASILDRRQRGMSAGTLDYEYRIVRPDGSIRWIETRGFPVRDDAGKIVRIAGVGEDITERKNSEEALRRFSTAIDTIADAIYLVDRSSMRYIHVNDAACRLQNQTRAELLALDPWAILGSSRAELERSFDAIIDSGMPAKPLEIAVRRPDGKKKGWVELRRHAQYSGDRWTIVTLVRDITERKEAEDRIRRLNRLYAVLSGINTLIVRVRDRDELFREACRIAVELGSFKTAWIGTMDPQTLEVTGVAWQGAAEGYVDTVRLSARDGSPDSELPLCRALRQSQPVICNDVATDPSVAPFREQMLGSGYKSIGCFPLTRAGQADAVMVLHAGEAGFFDEEETRLLVELAGDISFALDHIAKQERLNYLAYYDVLTGLANRSLFLDRVAQYMRSAVSSGHQLALYLVDLERFKNINDSLGRPAGDALLKQVAEWLTRHVGDANLVARVGADQFAVVLPELRQEGEAARQLGKMREAFLDHPFRLNDGVFRIAAKAGAAQFPDDGGDADTLFMNAEAALKKAKASGERCLFYTQKMTEAVAGRLTLENQLRQALDKGEFVLHYQPKVNLASGKLTGAEALIRWNDPRRGLVPPGGFVQILEETGLIHEVGRWALRKAVEVSLRWRAAGLAGVRIAVNVSPLQLRNRGFIADVEQVIGVDAHAAAGLELELTESLIMEDVKHSIASLQAIRAMGVSIAIDDFGTGFSSLSYLARLPLDTLKIDRSFVNDMPGGPEGLALVSTIINLGHSLKLKVVAEGVETEEQSRLLRLLRCDEMQGYLFSKAVPGEIFEARFLVPAVAA